MKKLLVLLLFMVSCAHTSDKESIIKLEKKIKQLEQHVDYLQYEQVNIYCFNFKDLCYLAANDTCTNKFLNKISRNQCIKRSHTICFKKHEKCIIDNYRKWKKIQKAKGRRSITPRDFKHQPRIKAK